MMSGAPRARRAIHVAGLLLAALLPNACDRSDGGVRVPIVPDAAPDVARPVPLPAFTLGWEDRTATAGLAGVTTQCRAVAFGDFDEDGAPDLVVPTHTGISVLRNDGRGAFTAWAAANLPESDAMWLGECCALTITDLDHDGHLDVLIGLSAGSRLSAFFGDGKGTFGPLTFGVDDGSRSCVNAIGVLTRPDGPTRLLVGRSRQNDEPFDLSDCRLDAYGVDVECRAVLPPSTSAAFRLGADGRSLLLDPDPVMNLSGYSLAVGVADFDGDGADDALVALDFDHQRALHATPSGFEDVSEAWGFSVYGHGMGLALGDADGDAVTDVVDTTLGGLLEFRGLGAKGFRFTGGASSTLMTGPRDMWPWGALFEDLDDDGRLDLYVANEYAHDGVDSVRWLHTIGGAADFVGAFHSVFYREPSGAYAEGRLSYESILASHGRAVSVAMADVDGDGHVEVALPLMRANDVHVRDVVLGAPTGRPGGHGLTVRLAHAAAASGTRVTLRCGGVAQVRELYGAEGHAGAPRREAHFGCGAATTFDSLEVAVRGRPPMVLGGGALDTALLVDVPW
jgi:hypothetical protein